MRFRRMFSAVCVIAALCGGRECAAAQRYWIFFRDKGPGATPVYKNPARYAQALGMVSARSLWRRAKVLPPGRLVGFADLPLYAPYIDSLRAAGVVPVYELRWFNAVTAPLAPEQIERIERYAFVDSVAPVRALCCRDPYAAQPVRAFSKQFAAQRDQQDEDSLDNGQSDWQLRQIQLTAMHDLGVTGNGVMLGMLDTGFRWRFCRSEQTADVWHEYDFINHDTITANDSLDAPGQDSHGTLTFSEICGWAPGNLIGGAFNAQFLLAKTEDIRSERNIEEDNYAAALQWMDSLGVDVTSSSLGYSRFDSGQVSYTYADMNGHTTIVARAVEQAVKNGICVVTAAGNGGLDTSWPYIISPGDADTAITCGAVDSAGVLAPFSSRGPTSDGRIKPDVCARGIYALGAGLASADDYVRASGTSLSTPLVASAAALLLSAHPGLTPVQVRNALRSTATQANAPDTAYGWGIVRALDAALSLGMVISNPPRVMLDPMTGDNTIVAGIKAQEGVAENTPAVLYATGAAAAFHTLPLERVGGTDFYYARFPALPAGDTVRYYVQAESGGGAESTSPFDAPRSLFSFVVGGTTPFRRSPVPAKAGVESMLDKYFLAQNYPSPFGGATSITFGMAQPQRVTLDAYSILGQRVAALFNGTAFGSTTVQWNAAGLPSGVYIIRIASPSFNAAVITTHKN